MTQLNATAHVDPFGQSVSRREDPPLLTGRGRFTDDIRIEGQACAMVLRSPHGHAEIKSIDTSAALSLPGVVGILSYGDLRGKVGDIRPNWVIGDSIVPAHPPLADGPVLVRANGALVGSGELVEIDGRIGVTLHRLGKAGA